MEDRLHSSITIRTEGPEKTVEVGRIIGNLLSSGDLICLVGELGTGKTTIVKGIAEGLGIKKGDVTSPTFIILREYKARFPLYHVDLYKVDTVYDIRDIGLEEVIYSKEGITAIEWADRIKDILPEDRMEIEIRWLSDTERDLEIRATGPHHGKILKEVLSKMKTA